MNLIEGSSAVSLTFSESPTLTVFCIRRSILVLSKVVWRKISGVASE